MLIKTADPRVPTSAYQYLDAPLLDRLLAILEAMLSATESDVAAASVTMCLQTLLESCSRTRSFWEAFRSHQAVPKLLGIMLVHGERKTVRNDTAILILGKAGIADDVLPGHISTSR